MGTIVAILLVVLAVLVVVAVAKAVLWLLGLAIAAIAAIAAWRWLAARFELPGARTCRGPATGGPLSHGSDHCCVVRFTHGRPPAATPE